MARNNKQSSATKPKRKELERRIAELEMANRELDGAYTLQLYDVSAGRPY
jgi:hypothetical protein